MTRCNHSGGTGIGAGHVCRCLREAGHPNDSERPHGCECGALWADKGVTVDVPPVGHKGPHDTDASALLQAAHNLEHGYKVGGSNVTAAVVELLRRVARELTDDPRTTSERRKAGA
ncbi:hypothetical protein GS982_19985 [Rhodococcus hoagii]|nr:hypothetical protein [Prescottella equi]